MKIGFNAYDLDLPSGEKYQIFKESTAGRDKCEMRTYFARRKGVDHIIYHDYHDLDIYENSAANLKRKLHHEDFIKSVALSDDQRYLFYSADSCDS